MKTSTIRSIKKNAVVPAYFHVNRSIKSVIIEGKEWFDRVNGNSYNAVQVFVNYGMKNAFSFSIPFQYGYGNYFEQSAIEHLVKIGAITSRETFRDLQRNGKIEVESTIVDKCLQRDVKAFGLELQQVK